MNGWTNWRTWNLYNWLSVNKEQYNTVKELTPAQLQEYCERPGNLPPGYYQDEQDAPAGEINYLEIYQALNE